MGGGSLSEQTLANFEGWAIVEIMGHQKVSGYVTTQYFGGTAVFRVVQQEQPPQESVLDRDQWLDGALLYAGSKVRISRERAETFVAASSLYRMTPCTEEQANKSQPVKIEVLERAERKALTAAERIAVIDEQDDDDEHDDPCGRDLEVGAR